MHDRHDKIKVYITLFFVLFFCAIVLQGQDSKKFNTDIDVKEEGFLKSSVVMEDFVIDDLPGSLINWSWASNQTWCSGNGTLASPYIIEDLVIDGGDDSSCIEIRNSRAYFIIRNCSLTNSGRRGDDYDYYAGIELVNVSNARIMNNTCENNQGCGIALYNNSDNNTITNNTANINDFSGIFVMDYCDNNTIVNNMANANEYGGITLLNNCDDNTIFGNIADGGISNIDHGIGLLGNCDNNNVSENKVFNNSNFGVGIADHSNSNNIINNTMDGNGYGLLISCYSNDNTISGNNGSNNHVGVFLWDSYRAILYNNRFFRSGGLKVEGSLSDLRTHDINTTNTVNGKPIYYYVDRMGLRPREYENASQIFLINCSYSEITGLTLTDVYTGIYLFGSSHNNISRNMVRNKEEIYPSGYGIHLNGKSDNNTISENVLSDGIVGISLNKHCNNNKIMNNNVSNNNNGISLIDYCHENNISGNVIYDNDLGGISLSNYCENNTISACKITNNTRKGILLDNYCVNNTISENNISGKDSSFDDIGIYISFYCDQNTISGNKVSDCIIGMYFYTCNNNNTIASNNVSNNDERGIYFYYRCDYNTISDNTVNDNDQYGIGFLISSGNTILRNSASNVRSSHQDNGIVFSDQCDENLVLENEISNNTLYGMLIDRYSRENTISQNIIQYNGNNGLVLLDNSNNNTIYHNFFIENGINAEDNASYNKWDYGEIGNYWHDYTGVDRGDGIGSTPYISGNITDNYPICSPPLLVLSSPTNYELFGKSPPNIDLYVGYPNSDPVEYMLINATNSAQFTDNHTWDGSINQSVWNQMGNGTVIIKFFVNNVNDYFNIIEVVIRKDIISPNIFTINPKENDIFGLDAPGPSNCTVSSEDISGIDAEWYMLINVTNGSHHTSNYTWNGYIDQVAWDQMGNGTIILRFYANDTIGNVGFADIHVRKSIYNLVFIDIKKPWENEIFSMDAPGLDDFDVSFSALDGIDGQWYVLINATNSAHHTSNYTWNGYIDQFAWDLMGNGTIIVRFYANDTSGNIGTTDIMIRKDIFAPEIIVITSEHEKLYGIIAPSASDITIFVSDPSGIESIQYMLINATNSAHYTAEYAWNGYIDQAAWDQMGNGTIIVRFFVLDMAGNQRTCDLELIKSYSSSGEPNGEDDSALIVTIVLASVGAVSAVSLVSGYTIYRSKKTTKLASKLAQRQLKNRKKPKNKKKKDDKYEKYRNQTKSSKEILNKLSNKEELLRAFDENIPAEVIALLKQKPLTIVSSEFLTTTDNIGFKGQVKEDFIREMLSFLPKERVKVVNTIYGETESVPVVRKRKREEVEDVIVYEGLALELIQEHMEKHKKFDPISIVPYLKVRFSRASININSEGIKRILKSLIEKNVLVEGSILSRTDILKNDNRRKIFECVQENPGIHFNKLLKKIKMSGAVIRWHLSVLDKFKFVRPEKIGNRKAYFDNEGSFHSAQIVHIISRGKCKMIIEYLELNSKGCQLTELSRELGIHYNTIKKYISKLEEYGVISSKKKSIYFINKKKLKEILQMSNMIEF
ncbi:MAG: right-handed parallel beta-helix repeat-containing protein [Candidatus Lokiarchaeota archaeon]|nr:right-handed parallel beta-helix repeat-containing protein [Candidatus Lokiarchaeota archaeon]